MKTKTQVTSNESQPHKKIKNISKWVSDIENTILIAQKEGALIGNVTNIFISLNSNKLFAIEAKKSFWGNKTYINTNEIESIGEDIILIKSKKSMNSINDKLFHKEYKSLKELKGFRITNLSGKHIGELKDLKVSLTSFEIKELLLESGKIISISSNDMTIGEDEVLVPKEHELKAHKTKEDTISQIKGSKLMANISETLHISKNKSNEKKQTTHL